MRQQHGHLHIFVKLISSKVFQRNFTRRIPGCSHMSYPQRLAFLNLQTLEHRRLIADLIMCFNIVKGNNCIDQTKFFSFTAFKFSRGHPYKLSIPLAKLNTRKFFFSNRVIPAWNALPADVLIAQSTSAFKHCVRKIDLSKFLILQTDSL